MTEACTFPVLNWTDLTSFSFWRTGHWASRARLLWWDFYGRFGARITFRRNQVLAYSLCQT